MKKTHVYYVTLMSILPFFFLPASILVVNAVLMPVYCVGGGTLFLSLYGVKMDPQGDITLICNSW